MYFVSGLTFGNAAYIGTGRGFAYRPTAFVQLYATYGRTHLQPGAAMLGLLVRR
jgi:hypothetical protein